MEEEPEHLPVRETEMSGQRDRTSGFGIKGKRVSGRGNGPQYHVVHNNSGG